MKKMEQNAENHKQYRDAYDKCHDWIKTMVTKLASCQDTSGNKDIIQSQLEKLHVILLFFYYKLLILND
jgi:hypothetical protein